MSNSSTSGSLRLLSVAGDGLRFEAAFANARLVLDGGRDAPEASPVQHLLASIAACEAMDVISLMRKKRQQVTAYTVDMLGERAAEHPRRFTALTFVHSLTGHDLKREAAEDCLRLTLEKYCSVYHTIRPDVAFTHRIELTEA